MCTAMLLSVFIMLKLWPDRRDDNWNRRRVYLLRFPHQNPIPIRTIVALIERQPHAFLRASVQKAKNFDVVHQEQYDYSLFFRSMNSTIHNANPTAFPGGVYLAPVVPAQRNVSPDITPAGNLGRPAAMTVSRRTASSRLEDCTSNVFFFSYKSLTRRRVLSPIHYS